MDGFVWVSPDFWKIAGTPLQGGGGAFLGGWVGGWRGGLLTCCCNTILLCICLLVAGFVCIYENNFSIRLTTPRQVIKIFTGGIEPASFNSMAIAPTTGSMVVPIAEGPCGYRRVKIFFRKLL